MRRLRRPGALAWALNRVARDHGQLIGTVLEAGATLRTAMEDAVRGGGGDLRDVERRARQASGAVVDAACRVLADAGRPVTDDGRARLAATLRAAVLAPDVADHLRAGTLERDVDRPGLGLEELAEGWSPPEPAVEAPPGPLVAGQEEADRRRQEQRAADEEARRVATSAVEAIEERAGRLAERSRRLTADADAAEDSARRARAVAASAQETARLAAERAAEARRALRG